MFVPKNVKIFEKAKALQFTVLEGGSPNMQLNVVKSWKIDIFKEDTLVIKMDIDDPSILSVTRVRVFLSVLTHRIMTSLRSHSSRILFSKTPSWKSVSSPCLP
jgi:hypothetical protein